MVEIFKNFLTKDECKILTQIAYDGVENGWMGPGTGCAMRVTSRMYMSDKKYPQYVIDISNKIREFMNIDHLPIIKGHGFEGVVVSITFPGGDVHKHQDSRSSDGLMTYRCNVMTQAADEGGKLYVDGKLIETNVGDLHCYYASEQPHYVTTVKGNTPRVLWMFGAHRTPEHYIENHRCSFLKKPKKIKNIDKRI